MKKLNMFIILFLCLSAFTGCVVQKKKVSTTPSNIEGQLIPAIAVDKTRTDLNRSIRPWNKKYNGPLIDAHVHLDPLSSMVDKKLKEILAVIEDGKVEYAVFMPTPNEGRMRGHKEGVEQKLKLKQMSPARIKVFCGSNYITYWLHRAYQSGFSEKSLSEIIVKLRKDIESKEFAGVGEIGIYHFSKHGNQPVIKIAPNFKPLLTIVDLVTQKKMGIDVHAEPMDPNGKSYEKEVFGGIELWHRRNPNLKMIFSHTGMTNPANVRQLLKKYPQMMMNFKPIGDHQKWRNLEPITNEDGRLYEDWALLFEEMPDRFMVGTDAKFGRKRYRTKKYIKEIKRIRKILGSINESAARLIAYDNAKRNFKN